GDIYQIAKVFRQGEAGRRHNPEFSMLEWYRVGWTYEQLMDEVAELVVLMLGQTADASEAERPPRLTLSYQQVLFEYAGIDVQQATAEEIQQKGIELAGGDLGLDRDGWLDVIMSHAVEPALPRNTLVFVHEFPASQAALARVVENESGQKVAQRFELFWNGSELANGYQELTDAEEQARRFSLDGRLVDQRLLDAMAHGLPECAGVAIGLDRILMHRLGVETISEVLAFDWNRA
ncbi:MAG: EF-P lysine aminoacylase GenX, partial [Oceanobacter sp.]